MNAVEIEEALSALASAPFNPAEFPFTFLHAFGNKETAVRRLRARSGNASDVLGGVLQRSNIHLAVSPEGAVGETLLRLRQSLKTVTAKAKFVLATDGITVEAEEVATGEIVSCDFACLGDHFGFFLPLAGISTVKQIKNNPIDVKATGRLNRLYVELLKENPDWGVPKRRHELNQFMARLIFCFFAENTGIFLGQRLFSETLRQMSDVSGSDVHEVISALFQAMDIRIEQRSSRGVRPWANKFPYVNGALFSGATECPRFSRIARSYLLRAGELLWRDINPDIFGSMIQAVADDEERGALGLHYTSVPNILRVLNPLFIDDLRERLLEAGYNMRKLLHLRNRLARIRVFDPACGSGNFLVIAYKQMREIEAEINRRRDESERASDIPLTNFRGIELRDFPAEIARLALIIAEYQADVLYRGEKLALAEFLPLDQENWITCGNALRLDWLSVCPPTGTGVKLVSDDLFQAPLEQAQIDFENEGGETYICGNPPYLGSKWQNDEHKADLKAIFDGRVKNWKSLDYVAGWLMKSADYGMYTDAAAAFVTTNSICQGQQVPVLWPLIFQKGHKITFAHTSFKWANLASNNAGVIVVIVGFSQKSRKTRTLFAIRDDGSTTVREVDNINAYLVASQNIEVEGFTRSISGLATMQFGNHPYYGAPLIFPTSEAVKMREIDPRATRFIRPLYGSQEYISGTPRACLWISDAEAKEAENIGPIAERMNAVKEARRAAKQDKAAQKLADTPYRFRDQETAKNHVLIVPRVSSESRPYLPVGLLDGTAVIQDQAFALYDAPLWSMSLIASRLHIVWIATVCGKLKTDFRYSSTLGWNTFPVPSLTESNKADLTRCAENILLAREAHFPLTIADLYNPEQMPDNLRRAHNTNDEVLERIYIGRRFRNDTERLEKLFDMYAETTAAMRNQKPRATRKSAA